MHSKQFYRSLYGILSVIRYQKYAGTGEGGVANLVFLGHHHGRVEDVRTEKRQEGSDDGRVLSGEVLGGGGFAGFVETGVPGTLLIDQLHYGNNSVFFTGAGGRGGLG